MRAVIAGATGFVGRALAARLKERGVSVTALSRGPKDHAPEPGIEWRHCDLFSLLQCEQALQGADVAFYLVHSMLPSAHLTQARFQDLDLIMADNFARAAAKAGVKQIVYLGGLLPREPELSAHLESRLEVERALGARGVPVTALRAGVIVGAGGASFEMMARLVRRLPVIPCPPWAERECQAVALSDVLDLLVFCLERPAAASRSVDIGGPEVLTYCQMLRRLAAVMGLKRRFVEVPFESLFLYRALLSLFTGAPRELVSPLLDSVRHPLSARDRSFQLAAGVPGVPFDEAARAALAGPATLAPHKPPFVHNVRSVQRLRMPPGKDARWAAERYTEWLARLFKTFIRAEVDEARNVRLMLRFPRACLLEHTFLRDRSSDADRQVFYITGGLLARPDQRVTRRARLEFRVVMGGRWLLVGVHDYRPTLPWRLYNLTQAVLHPWVVRGYEEYLGRQAGA